MHPHIIQSRLYSVMEAQGVQGVLQDNLYLKKNLQMARHQVEMLQQQLADERTMNQQLLDRNSSLSEAHAQLQRRAQLQAAQQSRQTTALAGQVDELKELIQHKQQELEEFQLRIIPNLDQDMLRVKLITEMEGPYQETLEKRDREIAKIKEKLVQAQRRAALSELQLETREKDLKREVEETKRYYQAQNEKLSKEASAAISRKETKGFEKELFKGQRKELQQLRFTIQLQSQNQAQLRKQVSSLKIEREKLLLQLGQLNEQRALQIHLSSDNEEVRSLKQERSRLEDEVARRAAEVERIEKRYKKELAQAKKAEQESRKRNIEQRELWERERETAREEINKLKLEATRARDKAERQQQEIQTLAIKLKNSERELAAKTSDNSKLRESIAQLQLTIRQHEMAKRQKLSLSKHFDTIEEKPTKKDYDQKEEVKEGTEDKKGKKEVKKENDRLQDNTIINRDDRRRDQGIASLQKANAKLREKLQVANQKIVQLLKDKAANGPQRPQQQPILGSNSRDRAFSNIQLDSMRQRTDKAFLLEYRDSSFTPLVPPTIFTQPY